MSVGLWLARLPAFDPYRSASHMVYDLTESGSDQSKRGNVLVLELLQSNVLRLYFKITKDMLRSLTTPSRGVLSLLAHSLQIKVFSVETGPSRRGIAIAICLYLHRLTGTKLNWDESYSSVEARIRICIAIHGL